MPTTMHEARKILEISQEYIDLADLKELFTRLDAEVGKTSENDSVKQSFAMFKQFADTADAVVAKEDRHARLTIYWFLISSLHHLLIFGNLASFCVAPFKAPWYLAFPACFAIIWVTCSPVNCALTRWENGVRKQLGWPEIRSFVGHNYLKPFRKFRKRHGW